MADITKRLEAFAKLGEFFRLYLQYRKGSASPTGHSKRFKDFEEIIDKASHKNGWFTPDNIHYALASWAQLLTKESLSEWLSTYTIAKMPTKNVAIIMAGNIPLVGFHDLLAVLLTGHKALIKPSSNDVVLLPFILTTLQEFEPSFKERIEMISGPLKGFDAVIATGSNNTSRYFEYYFGNKPHIIRKNRNSVAVLKGTENHAQLRALGEDIFRYFGLGCRSVSKLFVPEGYDFTPFFKAIDYFEGLKDHHKYANNYDYNKAVYLMSQFPFLDNGFFVLKEDQNYASPIGAVFYEHYGSLKEVSNILNKDKDKLQCIVSENFMPDEIRFGETQRPKLSDYADGVDTVEFLLKT